MYTEEPLHIRLKYYRNQKGLSQTEVAEELNLTRQAISNWESNKSYPDIDNIVLLSKLYEVSIDELLGANVKKDVIEEQSSNPDIFGKPSQTVLEVLCLTAILVFSSQFLFFGIIVSIAITIWLKKTNRKYKFIYFMCIICFLISIYNTFILLNHIVFDYFTYSVNPV